MICLSKTWALRSIRQPATGLLACALGILCAVPLAAQEAGAVVSAEQAPAQGQAQAQSQTQAPTQVQAQAQDESSFGFPTPLPRLKPAQPPIGKPIVKSPSLFGLPTPLNATDVATYKAIFEALRLSRFEEAQTLGKKLESPLLLGHVLAETYTNPEAPLPNLTDILEYLETYPTHPQASAVYDLGTTLTVNPLPQVTGTMGPLPIPGLDKAGIYASQAPSSPEEREAFADQITQFLIDDAYDAALDLINGTGTSLILDPTERDQQRVRVAEQIYLDGTKASFPRSYEIAAAASKRFGKFVPLSNWIAGLSAWRMGEFEKAESHFENCGNSIYWQTHDRSACHFWAGRSAAKRDEKPAAIEHFKSAFEFPNTLYGLLASIRLNETPDIRFSFETFSEDDRMRLKSWNPAARAYGLVQVGEFRLAELELLMVAREQDAPLRGSIRRLARRVGLPEAALRTGHFASVKRSQADYAYQDLYPKLAYLPADGFLIDRAMINSIVRKETLYRPEVESSSGAQGLMQLLPSTADFLVKSDFITPYGRVRDLQRPTLNITFGETYIAYLLQRPAVKRSIIKMLIAYNAGPGSLARWVKRANSDDDMLLLMESLPASQSRTYVDRVLRNLFMYRLKFKQPVDDFQALASGRDMIYFPKDRIGEIPDDQAR